MGMFDTVVINCKMCGQELEIQTKSGPCNLHRFTLQDLPIIAADDIDGASAWCPKCQVSSTVILKVISVII